MKAHRFTIVASGLNHAPDALEDRLYEAGCDDATVSFTRGRILVDFDREAKNFVHAVVSAAADVERAGARVERIEPDELVAVSDIAERAGLTRQAVSLFARGARGQGFPSPVARVSSDAPLWDWAEVAAWLHARGSLDTGAVVEARLIGWANGRVSRRDGERVEAVA